MSIYFRNKSKLSINEDSRGLVDKNLIDGYDLMKERNFTNSIKVGECAPRNTEKLITN